MATATSRSPSTVDDLLAAVRKLPPADLREFQREFAAWSGKNNRPRTQSANEGDDEALLAVVGQNSALPASEQRRFNRLRRKQEAGTLTGTEQTQLQALWRQVEQMNVTRLEALDQLARRRGTDLKTLMRQLGLPENHDVF